MKPSMSRWLRFVLWTSALALLFTIVVFSKTPSKKPPAPKAATQAQMLANASRRDENGWIYVHLEGAPHVVGFQQGYLLAKEIVDLRGALALLLDHTTTKKWNFYRAAGIKLFWAKTPREYQQEIDGIVDGVRAKLGPGKIDRADIVAMNAMEELAY